MDILRAAFVKLGILSLLFVALLPDIGYATSIFEMILGDQPVKCSSLTNPVNQSLGDPSVIHPPAVGERLNYEYSITTPNFPNSYPTNIQCIALIKAPNYDYNIILEVRQLFDIEPAKYCDHDFLEITDGPYGFSKRIGRYCNEERPPKEVKSSGPFLWLRFYSDNTLPHNGFKLVYRFIRNTRSEPITPYCYSRVMIPKGLAFNLNTSFLLTEVKNSVVYKENKTIPFECVFDFHVSKGYHTFAYKAFFKKPTYPIPCASNNFEIYYKGTFENSVSSPKKANFFRICEESDFPQRLLRHSTRTTVRISVTDVTKINTISLILTSVMNTKNKCPPDYFLCSDRSELCISKKLQCNGEPNCPDLTDEKCIDKRPLHPGEVINITTTSDPLVLKKSKEKQEEIDLLRKTNQVHAIILGSIASILVISMVFCLVLTIHSKKKDKETRCVNVVDVPTFNQDKPQNKNLFYELLQSSEPSVAALSTEKLSRKIYNDNQIWSKRPFNNSSNTSAHRNYDSNFKLNGGIKMDSTVKSVTNHPFKSKVDTAKGTSLNKIGKYLSVPYPAKSETNLKPTIHIQPFNIASPSDDFQSWSSNSFSKQNSSSMNRSMHHIQRASSMGSGLRRQLQEPVDGEELSKNVEWYCGPVIRGGTNRNNSSETLNAYSAKSSQHVPGCRSLPNFSNLGLQNPVYYTKPAASSGYHHEPDSLDCSADDNSSYREDTPSFSLQANHYQKPMNSHKYPEHSRNNGAPSSHYGFKYFCAHEPMSGHDFVEYIA